MKGHDTEGPFASASQCNAARQRMVSAGGFRVGACVARGRPARNTQAAPPAQKVLSPAERKPVKAISIPDGQQLNNYCAFAQGVLKGSTREWYLGCCPGSHPILRSKSPTLVCGSEEARKAGIECSCYKNVEACIGDKSRVGICY